MELIENLTKFGLSEKESKVYLACLELGESSASDISLKSNLPRTLVYDILERLIDMGVISYSIRANKKHVSAANPKELFRIIKEKEEAIKEIMPSLEKLNVLKGSKRPKVEIYEGVEGMKNVMNDILRCEKNVFRAYGSSRSSYAVMPAFMDDWHKERIKKKIVMRILYNKTKEAKERIKASPRSLKLTEFKFMPIELEFPNATLIYANKVVLQSWTKEPFAVMIEDEGMAENQRRYFEQMWKLAKK
jgi:sugar-specific transcriptional regulator TrmB